MRQFWNAPRQEQNSVGHARWERHWDQAVKKITHPHTPTDVFQTILTTVQRFAVFCGNTTLYIAHDIVSRSACCHNLRNWHTLQTSVTTDHLHRPWTNIVLPIELCKYIQQGSSNKFNNWLWYIIPFFGRAKSDLHLKSTMTTCDYIEVVNLHSEVLLSWCGNVSG